MTESMTEQPTTTPDAAPEAAPETAEAPAPRRPRRVLRALARWTAAVVVCGGVGTGVALGITAMDREDLPGLAAESDGRWQYPVLRLPALPADRPRPFTLDNEAEIHYADPRELLLPAPAGATVDPKADGGFVSTEAYLSFYGKEYRAELRQALADAPLRHIVARSWTMPDGTRTGIHLLRFTSVAYAQRYEDENLRGGYGSVGTKTLPDGVEGFTLDSSADAAKVEGTDAEGFRERKPHGPEETRWAYVQAGDTIALIAQTRKGEVLDVPFRQTVTLQNQLLG